MLIKIKKIFFISLFFSFLINTPSYAGVSARNTTSVITVKSGSNFVIENAISGYKGTIVKEEGATLSGSDITLDEGKIQDEGNKFNITGVFTPGSGNKIALTGGKIFRGKGGTVLQAIEITGTGNKIEGDCFLNNDISFLNSNASLNFNLLSSVGANIQLNGGTLTIDENLCFIDAKRIVGPGKIVLNGNKLSFGACELVWSEPLYFDSAADIELNSNICLEEVWTFSGSSILNGNSNVCCPKTDGGCVGRIVIERGSSLLIKNLELRNVTDETFYCMDNAATITFQNVKLILGANYTFSQSRFEVLNKLKISGGYQFAYRSNKQSNILVFSSLNLDKNVTFSYDPITAQKDRLSFGDQTSIFSLNNASLHTTSTGLQLIKGTLEVVGNSYLSSSALRELDGIILGDGQVSGNDFTINVREGSQLELLSGFVVYNNVS